MSKLLQAMLFPFMHKFQFGDGDAPAAETPATESSVAPESTDTPTDEPVKEEAVAPKTYTEDEIKALLDAEAAKTRNRYERKLKNVQVDEEAIRARVLQEVAAKSAATEDEPREEDFTDYGEFIKASARFAANQVIAKERENQKENETRSKFEKEQSRRDDLAEKLDDNGHEKYHDFKEVAESTGDLLRSKGLSFSPAMMGALLEAENSHDIVYFLGQNPDEALRLANLTPYAQAKEIGKLEDKLNAAPKKQISKAPAPITPVSTGKASNDSALTDDLPIDEWLTRRNKQVRGR
jgi:hypothetical protein